VKENYFPDICRSSLCVKQHSKHQHFYFFSGAMIIRIVQNTVCSAVFIFVNLRLLFRSSRFGGSKSCRSALKKCDDIFVSSFMILIFRSLKFPRKYFSYHPKQKTAKTGKRTKLIPKQFIFDCRNNCLSDSFANGEFFNQ